jgi:hypothetical protein
LKFKVLKLGFISKIYVLMEFDMIQWVACRDYPHPRHFCLNFPFGSTPNSSHCDLCYCYVCDKPAPCAEWTISTSHCNAYDSALWNLCRT